MTQVLSRPGLPCALLLSGFVWVFCGSVWFGLGFSYEPLSGVKPLYKIKDPD